MNGSDSAKDASAQPPAPAAGASAANSNGNSAINKKRKKDGLKPIITTESPGYVHFPSSVPVCPATSPVVGFLVVRHPVPRQDMHIPLLMPHAKAMRLVWHRAAMLGDCPGQVAGCGRRIAKGEKRRRRPIRQGRRHHCAADSIHSTPIQRESPSPPRAWALGRGESAFPGRSPCCGSSVLQQSAASHHTPQNPPHTAPSAPPRLPATTTTNLRANLGQPHDAQFACRYPRDPSFTPFTQPRLRPRPRAGAGATESKMRTMLHNKTRSPLLLCARPVSAFHRGSAGGIPLSRGVGAALKVRHRAPAQLNPNPATLTRAAAAALALLHLASPNRAHATAF